MSEISHIRATELAILFKTVDRNGLRVSNWSVQQFDAGFATAQWLSTQTPPAGGELWLVRLYATKMESLLRASSKDSKMRHRLTDSQK